MAREAPTFEEELPLDGSREIVEEALALARGHLEMDLAWLAEFRGGRTTFRAIDVADDSWDVARDASVEAPATYCHRVLTGALPSVIPDARADEAVRDLAITTQLDIGAYVGVPLVLGDGSVYGTFCCLHHAERPDLGARDVRFLEVLARLVARELDRRRLELRSRRLAIRDAGVRAMLLALDARDAYTGEHSEAVVELAIGVGRRLGLAGDELLDVEQVALVHDIGKVGVPDAILRKDGPLAGPELVLMRRHPIIGAEIVAGVPELTHLAPAVRAEHERWDGGGYPDGLAAEAIPVASRIVLACDSFHAMVSDRPYRRAMDLEQAVLELVRHRGTQFWPEAADALLLEVGTRI
ncbi:MAG: HD domain-containing protein [Solirubrobacterales bacterium]|nr:HD domain-containing protein [Solirubrobacterales bacterium]